MKLTDKMIFMLIDFLHNLTQCFFMLKMVTIDMSRMDHIKFYYIWICLFSNLEILNDLEQFTIIVSIKYL